MNILSIDASTKSSGFAVHNSEGKLLMYKCVVAEGANLYKRIDKMAGALDTILHEFQIDEVYMEDVYPEDVHHNQKVYKALIYLQGFICHKLDEYKLTPTYFTSSEWRKKCGIKVGPRIRRETLKERDILFVKDTYGVDVNDDIADAICIGYAALHKGNDEAEIIDGFEFK